jgi:hypothetical protein
MHEKRRSHLNSGLGGAIKPPRGLDGAGARLRNPRRRYKGRTRGAQRTTRLQQACIALATRCHVRIPSVMPK